MGKKIKYFLVFINLLVIVSYSTCYGADEVKQGYYRLRNCETNKYMDVENSDVIQKSFSSYFSPTTFLLTKKYISGIEYSIHPKKSLNYCMTPDALAQTNAEISERDFRDNEQEWSIKYDSKGMFNIVSYKYGTYLSVGTNNDKYLHFYNSNGSNKQKWYLEKEFEDGIYKIKNKATGKYLTLGDYHNLTLTNDASYKSNFHIVSYSDGYSDIMPVSDENYSISVVGWDTGRDDENAVVNLQAGQSSEGQMWRFFANKDGSFRLMSELSDNNKCITANGDSVRSCTFDDNNQNNRWVLEPLRSDYEERSAFIAAFHKNSDSFDERGILAQLAYDYKQKNSYTELTTCDGVDSPDDLLKELKRNQLVSITSHAAFNGICTYTKGGASTNPVALTMNDIDTLSSKELSKIKICLLSGCNTAQGNYNITRSIYSKGAKCVVGFEKEIKMFQANNWVYAFNKMIAKGGNVKLSLSYADWYVLNNASSTGETDSHKVYGDSNISFGD